jgi:hypothetical protein
LQNGVCCFLCGWLKLSPYEYTQQYARFGVGQFLEGAEQIGKIPERLEEWQKQSLPSALSKSVFSKQADPAMLQRWLIMGSPEYTSARSVS